MPVGLPVPPEVTCQLRAGVHLGRLRQAERQRGADVLVISVQSGEPLGPARPERFLPSRQCRIPVTVPNAELALAAVGTQLTQPELADGVQQPVPCRAW